MILTLDEIKTHLKIELSDASQDDELEAFEAAAVDYASGFIGRSIPWTDEAGAPVDVPPSVKAALKLLIADLDQQRQGIVLGLTVSKTQAAENMLHFYRVGMGI